MRARPPPLAGRRPALDPATRFVRSSVLLGSRGKGGGGCCRGGSPPSESALRPPERRRGRTSAAAVPPRTLSPSPLTLPDRGLPARPYVHTMPSTVRHSLILRHADRGTEAPSSSCGIATPSSRRPRTATRGSSTPRCRPAASELRGPVGAHVVGAANSPAVVAPPDSRGRRGRRRRSWGRPRPTRTGPGRGRSSSARQSYGMLPSAAANE